MVLDYEVIILSEAKGKCVPFDCDFRPGEPDGRIGFLAAKLLASYCLNTVFFMEIDHAALRIGGSLQLLSVTDDYQGKR